jgi:hypothetical protein
VGDSELEFSGLASDSFLLFGVEASSIILSFRGDANGSASILSQLLPDLSLWKHFGVFDSGLYK